MPLPTETPRQKRTGLSGQETNECERMSESRLEISNRKEDARHASPTSSYFFRLPADLFRLDGDLDCALTLFFHADGFPVFFFFEFDGSFC